MFSVHCRVHAEKISVSRLSLDVDFGHRAQAMGINLVELVPPLPLYHLGGSTGALLDDRRAITVLNQKRFAQKWMLKEPQ